MLENQPTLTNKWIIGYDQATRESSLILFFCVSIPPDTIAPEAIHKEFATEIWPIYCVGNEFSEVK